MIDDKALSDYVQQQQGRIVRLNEILARRKAGKALGSDDEQWLKERMALDADTMAGRLVTKADLALLFNRTKRQIQTYCDEGMPRKDDLYPLGECLAWFIARKIGSDLQQDLQTIERRYHTARADEKEAKAALAGFERRIKEGELLDAAEVERGRVARIILLRTTTAALADQIRGLYGRSPEEIAAWWADKWDELCRRFATGEAESDQGFIDRIFAAADALTAKPVTPEEPAEEEQSEATSPAREDGQ